MLIFLLWVGLCALVGYYAKSNGHNFGTYMLLSLLLSPIVGFIIVAVKGKNTGAEAQSGLSGSAPIATPLDRPDFTRFESGSTYLSNASVSPQLPDDVDEQIPNTPQKSKIDELKEYKELLDMGIITEEEFKAKKTQILNS